MCGPFQPLVLLLLAILAAVSGLTATQASAEKRVALVIGNSAYKNTSKLTNPRNDATDVAAAFRALGFEVVEGLDLDKIEMDYKVRDFARLLANAELAAFFYAGHGLQVSGINYMVPVDAVLSSPASVDFELVRLDLVQRTMEWGPKTNILFLDACRNNPLARNLANSMGTRAIDIGRGLAPAEAGVGTLISFSTQPGNVALDGSGRNSPFAGALVRRLETVDEDLSGILIRVRNDVMKATENRQVPWEHSALTGRVFFKAPPAQPEAAKPEPAPQPVQQTSLQREPDPRLELELWTAVKDTGSVEMLKAYLTQYPQGTFSRLAALKIAEVEKLAVLTPSTPAPAPTPSTPTPALVPSSRPPDLEKRLQEALKRVGCYSGNVDGVWGETSEAALRKFAAASSVRSANLERNEMTLDAVAAVSERMCPLECDRGTVARDGLCVPQAQPAKPQPAKPRPAVRDDDRSRKRTAPPAAARTEKRKPPEQRFQMCLDARNQMVDCNDGGVVLRR